VAGAALAALVVAAALLAGTHRPATGSSSADRLGMNPTVSAGDVALPATADVGRDAVPALQHASLPSAQARVIRTADVSLRVDHGNLQGTVVKARQLAKTYGGMVAASSFSSHQHLGSVELRIPSAHFDDALKQLGSLGNVTGVHSRGEDVTAQYIDLAARERNLRTQERVLRGLMGQARTIEDSIKVQNELSAVQGQIEELQGRLRYLRDQTAMSTIAIGMTEAGVPAPATPGAVSKAWERAKHRALSVLTAIIAALGFVLPAALLAGLAILIGRPLWRRYGTHGPGTMAAPPVE
jgi:hypothetical protein